MTRTRGKRRKVFAVGLNPEEVRKLAKVARYVRGFCGPVSNAEVLRYLVRNWSGA